MRELEELVEERARDSGGQMTFAFNRGTSFDFELEFEYECHFEYPRNFHCEYCFECDSD